MLQRIKLHSLCIVKRPRTLSFHAAGIMREIELAAYLATPLMIRLWCATH